MTGLLTGLLVALGAAVGAPLRYWLGRGLDRPGSWHVGTLAANTLGSLLLGLCTAFALEGAALGLLGTGFCGALTTYSSFAVQARERGARAGSAYAVTTVALALLAVGAGFWCGAQVA